MSLGRTLAVALQGLDGTVVEVEAHVATGLPAFTVVGLPDSSMLQARDRVRAAAAHIGHSLPSRRITVNLVPAWLPKHGSGFDLAVAVAVLTAQGVIPPDSPRQTLHLGELGLDARLRPVPGVLPALVAARDRGVTRAVVPADCFDEARLVEGMNVLAAEDLAAVARVHGAPVRMRGRAGLPVRGGTHGASLRGVDTPALGAVSPDFADVIGQAQARAAAEVAAAGGHHLLLVGPPGAGKTMIATRLPSILPDLSMEESLVVSSLHSLAGRFRAADGLIRRPPFEAPHHTATTAAVVGGGSGTAAPGAISRAHGGVLFLDEAPEFPSGVLEALREPLERGDITLHRSRAVVRYPARFQLVMAANPCPCGHGGGRGERCTCTSLQRRRYAARLSGPVLDRIDLRIDVPPADTRRVMTGGGEESSAVIAARVAAARRRQEDRFADLPFRRNCEIPGPLLRRDFRAAPAEQRLLQHAVEAGRLSLRGHDRVMRVAWTLADLAGADRPGADHVGQALQLRGSDRR
ncbi:YifB family Mg chelatase-like AAA ATPase [Brachybacterium sp. EF45031]|uniref:YifB family Mg chelatase-like AAA ATPase n=1 Tax=Brachybacterium sillae TaxID=2810536 RepID=UPI00217DD86A|nr:YifB family Mg chelatase-like AAA ATPase [Brachybacterium sillae]MCS6712327.1 YifB family Mg chelatase-like AAA ATPase [Brachybacterium sillae]